MPVFFAPQRFGEWLNDLHTDRMQIIRSFNTQHLPLLTCAAIASALGLLVPWSPGLVGLFVGLAVLGALTRLAGASSAHAVDADAEPAGAASTWSDDLFTEPSPSSPSIEAIETIDMLRPNDLHVFGDGLLSGGCWDDDFSNCGVGSSQPCFD